MSCCNSSCNHDPCGSSFNQLLTKAGQYAQYTQSQAVAAKESEEAAEAAQAAAEAAAAQVEGFESLYLGAKDVPPALDNQGNPLQEGALYFNTIIQKMYVWDGTNWITASNVTGFNEATNFLAAGSVTPENLQDRFEDIDKVKDFPSYNFLATGTTAPRNLQDRFADVMNVRDFANGDLAARAAFDAKVPLNVLSGESAKIICNPTAGDDFKAMCLWFAQCDKAEDATFYIELADGGHTVNTYVELYNTNIAVDLRGSGTPDEILISSISYGTINGDNIVTATVTLPTAIPASYSVGDPVGMQNIQGDNDATSASGGQIIKSIALNRLSFTFDFFSPKGQPTSPTILNNSIVNGIENNKALFPKSWLRCDPAWDGGAIEGFINLYTGSRMIMRYIGLKYNGAGQIPGPDERDMLFAKNNGSFFWLYDKVVIAGTGDKNIRLYNQAGIYINRSCIGSAAKGDRWLDIANGCAAVAIRSSFGGAGEHGITVGDGSVLTLTSCILGSATRALYAIGANASIAFDSSQISNAITGIYALEGSVSCSTNARIQRSTTGVSVINDAGFVFGKNNITFTTVTTEVSYTNKAWTPVFSGITAPTYTVQSGEYTQIGSLIFCSAKITVSVLDNTDTSAIQIQMPIAPNTTHTAALVQVDTINSDLLTTTSRNAVLGAYFSFGNIVFSTGTSTLKYNQCLASGSFIFSVTYFA